MSHFKQTNRRQFLLDTTRGVGGLALASGTPAQGPLPINGGFELRDTAELLNPRNGP